jgi:hypothetical protein
MRDAFDWLGFYRSFWESRLTSLARHLRNDPPTDPA